MFLRSLVLLTAFIFTAGCGNMGNLSVTQIKEKIKASDEISKLTKTSDYAAMEKVYSKDLQVLVKSLDKDFALSMNTSITAALANAKANKEPASEVQVVLKTLTRVFYLALSKSLDSAEKTNDLNTKMAELQKAAAYNTAAGVPAQRRDKTVKPSPKLEEALTNAFSALEKSAQAGNKMEFMLQKKVIIDTLNKSYALSVLFEAEELIKARNKDPEFVKVKVAEGITYYKILQGAVVKNSPKSDEIIMNMLAGPAANYDENVLRSELNKGLGDVKLK
ncbi:MAG: hypothetical protein A2252_04095 [Elusimicrobia bacterium RIFOXYA2_FULL_39_19]|nr:MAG: hypothetical protein A2252_04095 [Elusimicrobia bacterium RIFOXYA2_FULL_39_19]